MIVETKKQTVADFDALPEGTLVQLIDGELMASPAPTRDHQWSILQLSSQFNTFVLTRNLGAVYCSPIDVYFTDEEAYQPDIIFISQKKLNNLGKRIDIIPDLIVEVLSPSNAYHDLVHKKNVYEAHGVKEYWIVDPIEKTIEVFENRDGQFVTIAKARKAGRVSSKLLEGFSTELNSIFSA
jgi:Uma2 family endonuclease